MFQRKSFTDGWSGRYIRIIDRFFLSPLRRFRPSLRLEPQIPHRTGAAGVDVLGFGRLLHQWCVQHAGPPQSGGGSEVRSGGRKR